MVSEGVYDGPAMFPNFDFLGRCRTCGFAAKHQRLWDFRNPGPTYFEIERDEREGPHQGRVFAQAVEASRGSITGVIPTDMVCFVGAALYCVVPTYDTKSALAAREELNKDRGCRSWYPYRRGHSPKEHYEERRMLDQERRQEEVTKDLARMATEIRKASLRTQGRIAGIAVWQVAVSLFAVSLGGILVFAAAWLFQSDINNVISPVNNIVIQTSSPTPMPTPELTPDVEGPAP